MVMISELATVLTDFQSVRLSDMVSQEQSIGLLIKGMVKAEAVMAGKTSDREIEKIRKRIQVKFNHFALSPEAIGQRYMALWPENYDNEENFQIAENGSYVKYKTTFPMYEDLAERHTNPEGADLDARMSLYRAVAEKHVRLLYDRKKTAKPDRIVHVTSTGYIEPNPVDIVLSENRWFDVHVTNFYNRACNAPISAIRTANALLRSSFLGGCEKAVGRVDILQSELFSIHMKIADDQAVNIGLMTSYSDSFIRYSLISHDAAMASGKPCLKILWFSHMMIPDSSRIAVWTVSNPAFDYQVDPLKYLRKIREHVRDFITGLFRDADMDYSKEKDRLLFVIQAPSPLILKQIGKQLELSAEQMQFSLKMLYENGYLSSGAIPFMCMKIIDSSQIPKGTKILCIGHALGLTISGMLLEKA
ncbi:MAG: hypothetical protein HGA62_04505 [Chlorobiaceae bacterium]|nr:hypothetical protein [Chlorobiaceae bacterium]NTV60394.1 hypothetical protein [Chlorobiaceae bacterium]